jgi:hypothetical protein
MTRILSIAAALVVVLASFGLLASPAAAHERRTVGAYSFVVGWLDEPSYVGLLNGLDLTVTEATTTKPVEGLEKTLKAEIIFGGGAATMPLTLASRFGQPGKYQGQVVPTKAGDYTFHITGTIGTQTVDERFESGPGRFGGIEPLASLQFPDKVLSTADLAAKLDDANGKLTIAIAFAAVALVVSVASLAQAMRRR